MGFFSSIGKAVKSLGKTVVNSFSSTSGLLTGGLGKGYLDSLGDTITSGLSNAWDQYTGADVAKANLEAQEAQWQTQNDLNERQFQYQAALNHKQHEREDTAYQRKVADMTAAGFNPILAASGSGSSSTLGVSPALHTAPAPQRENTSVGVREGVGQLASAVFQAISMKKDFAQKDAQIKLLQSEKDKVDAEAAGIRTENEYKADWLNLRNENLDLENQLKSGTLQANIDLATSKLSISRKEELVKNMELMLSQADYDLKQVDLEISKLIKEGKITENQILDKKLEILTTEALQKALDYSNAEWDTNWYHGLNLPVGFNAGWMGQLSLMIGALGSNGIKIVSDLISSIFGDSSGGAGSSSPSKLSKAEIKQVLRRPVGSNILWTRNMIKNHDFGVRRNF